MASRAKSGTYNLFKKINMDYFFEHIYINQKNKQNAKFVKIHENSFGEFQFLGYYVLSIITCKNEYLWYIIHET